LKRNLRDAVKALASLRITEAAWPLLNAKKGGYRVASDAFASGSVHHGGALPGCPMRKRTFNALLSLACLSAVRGAHATSPTVPEVRDLISRAKAGGTRPELSGLDLSDLDLSKLDFAAARMVGTRLFSARLVSANMAGADLTRAILNGAWLMGTNFNGAVLVDAMLMSVVVLGGQVTTKPSFAGADLSGARVIAEFAGVDFSGARLARANLGVDIKNQGMGQMRTNLAGAKLAAADLAGADLNRSILEFADLTKANLAGVSLFRAKLAGADLRGANVAGADFSEADLDGARFEGAQGVDKAKGLDSATNRDRAHW
jgi:uncharacterized protein YjbI with pentapeptide repeats